MFVYVEPHAGSIPGSCLSQQCIPNRFVNRVPLPMLAGRRFARMVSFAFWMVVRMNRIGSGVREAGGHLDGFGFQAIAPCDAETPAWDSAAEEAGHGQAT